MAPRSSSNGSGTASERPRGGDVEGASKCERHACDVGGILTRQDIRRCIGDLRRLAIAHHGEHAVSPSSRGSTSPRINGVDAKHQVAPTSPAMDQMLTTYPRPSVHMAGMTACMRRGAIWWTSSACPTHWRRILARIPALFTRASGPNANSAPAMKGSRTRGLVASAGTKAARVPSASASAWGPDVPWSATTTRARAHRRNAGRETHHASGAACADRDPPRRGQSVLGSTWRRVAVLPRRDRLPPTRNDEGALSRENNPGLWQR